MEIQCAEKAEILLFISFSNSLRFEGFSAQGCAWLPVQTCPQTRSEIYSAKERPRLSSAQGGIIISGCWGRAFAWARMALHVKWWGKLLWNENQCSFTNPGLGSLQKPQCRNPVSLSRCSDSFRFLTQPYLVLRKSVIWKGPRPYRHTITITITQPLFVRWLPDAFTIQLVALPSPPHSSGWIKKMAWRREPATCRTATWIPTPTASASAGPSKTETRWEPTSSTRSWTRSATTSSTSRTSARYVGLWSWGPHRTHDGLLRAEDWVCPGVTGEKSLCVY